MNEPIISLVRGTLLIALMSLLTSCSRQEMLWEWGDVVTNGDQHNHSFAWYAEMNSVIVLHFPMHLIQELNMPPIIQVGENQFFFEENTVILVTKTHVSRYRIDSEFASNIKIDLDGDVNLYDAFRSQLDAGLGTFIDRKELTGSTEYIPRPLPGLESAPRLPMQK